MAVTDDDTQDCMVCHVTVRWHDVCTPKKRINAVTRIVTKIILGTKKLTHTLIYKVENVVIGEWCTRKALFP